MRAVRAEEDPLPPNLPPYSCSSTRFGDDPASQIPVRGAQRRADMTADDPTEIGRARIAARDPCHSHCLVLREERKDREEVSPFVCSCQEVLPPLPSRPDFTRPRSQ